MERNIFNPRALLGLVAAAAALFGIATLTQAAAPTSAPRAMKTQQDAVWNHDEVALVLIDYQPEMFTSLRSETKRDLVELNTIFLARVARTLDIPVVLSTVAVEMGINKPTVASIADELKGIQVIDRTSMNAWEDKAFVDAVKATGKRRLVFGALYTEICLVYPVIEARKEGFDVMFVEDAVGGISQIAHATAIQRMIQAGAVPNTSLALAAELFRDWKTAEAIKVRPVLLWYLDELKKRGLQ